MIQSMASTGEGGHRVPTQPPDLSLRQTIEDMTVSFNPAVADRLTAVIQFAARGAEPGVYHLSIAGGECTFHTGPAAAPTLTIATPSEVWLRIHAGQLDGAEALQQGLYRASGDLSLLRKMGEIFRPPKGFTIAARDPYPPGPIRLSGLVWMQAAWAPWYLFWVLSGLHNGPLLEVGLPLVLILGLIAYRARYHAATWFEWGTAVFFALAAVLTVAGVRGFDRASSLVGSLAVAMLWFGSLFAAMPLCGDYVKWGFIKPVWRNSRFIYPNAVISLVWGYSFVVAALAGLGAALQPDLRTALTVVRFALIVPPMWFTIRYERQARQLRLADYERPMVRLRLAAAVGLAMSVALLEAVCIAL
jgi:putative sterol carrier protein